MRQALKRIAKESIVTKRVPYGETNCLIDANWGNSTDSVYEFCRQSTYASILTPCHGRFVGASSLPFSEYKRKPGEQVGHNWRMPSVQGKRAIRHVLFDANFWKSFIYARLAVAMGDPGGLSLFGERADAHRLLIEHLLSEYRVKTEGRGRVVDEWKQRPERTDNHWWDGIVGCAVAASILGATLPGTQATVVKRKTVVRTAAEWKAWLKGRRFRWRAPGTAAVGRQRLDRAGRGRQLEAVQEKELRVDRRDRGDRHGAGSGVANYYY